VTGCIADAYAIYETDIPDLPPVLEGLAAAVDERRVWFVEDAAGISGVMILSVEGTQAMLENVAVAPRRAGEGLGRRLIDQAVAMAVQNGCTELRLNTHARMTANISLYEHLGWEVMRTRGNSVSMMRKLSDLT
jgi:ribosomal protein S18 acetylase RimI-like enzyme